MELNESQIETINRMLGESAPVVVKKVVAKKVQKDEGEEDEKDEKREVKNFKTLDKLVTKLAEYLKKTEDEKALKVVEKIAEIVGTELEAHEDEE